MAFDFSRLLQFAFLPAIALIAGSGWTTLSLNLHRDLPWGALIVPLAMLPMRGRFIDLGNAVSSLLFALIAGVGIAWAQVLSAAASVAMQFGFGLTETLLAMGIGMTWELINLRNGPGEWFAMLIAVLVAALSGRRWRQERVLTPQSAP